MRFKNYKNSYTNDNRIYSKDEMLDMTVRQIKDRAEEFIAQHRVLGLPDESELAGSDNVVHVESYTRSDGTEVKAHWRSKPGEGSNNTNDAVNEESITKAISACGYSGVTFEDTIKDFANVIINTSESGTTLNKGFTTANGLEVKPINLNFSRKNGTKTESFKPKIYYKEDMPDLYPSGFSVHKVGSNLKSFTYYKPIKDGKTSIGYDVIIQ